MKVIAVFGSTGPVEGDKDYEDARAVGRLLAENGYAVSTGGYGGVMEAASRGAAEAGGHVIGITSSKIEEYRPDTPPNQYITEEIKYDSLQERMLHVVKENDGMVVMPGGIGTLGEFALAWNLVQVNELSPRPIVLFGPLWKDTVDVFFDPAYVDVQYVDALGFVDSAEAAIEFIKK